MFSNKKFKNRTLKQINNINDRNNISSNFICQVISSTENQREQVLCNAQLKFTVTIYMQGVNKYYCVLCRLIGSRNWLFNNLKR